MAGLRSTRALKTLYRHTCTVQRATLSTTADPYHPGSGNVTVDWDTIAASSTGIDCSWQRLDAVEQAAAGKAGTVVATDYLWMTVADAPSTLLDRDSVPAPETFHRITNVAVDGVVLDAGPFDIQRIIEEGGGGAVLKLELKRVQ